MYKQYANVSNFNINVVAYTLMDFISPCVRRGHSNTLYVSVWLRQQWMSEIGQNKILHVNVQTAMIR